MTNPQGTSYRLDIINGDNFYHCIYFTTEQEALMAQEKIQEHYNIKGDYCFGVNYI